jgi:hypothetical protein
MKTIDRRKHIYKKLGLFKHKVDIIRYQSINQNFKLELCKIEKTQIAFIFAIKFLTNVINDIDKSK